MKYDPNRKPAKTGGGLKKKIKMTSKMMDRTSKRAGKVAAKITKATAKGNTARVERLTARQERVGKRLTRLTARGDKLKERLAAKRPGKGPEKSGEARRMYNRGPSSGRWSSTNPLNRGPNRPKKPMKGYSPQATGRIKPGEIKKPNVMSAVSQYRRAPWGGNRGGLGKKPSSRLQGAVKRSRLY